MRIGAWGSPPACKVQVMCQEATAGANRWQQAGAIDHSGRQQQRLQRQHAAIPLRLAISRLAPTPFQKPSGP